MKGNDLGHDEEFFQFRSLGSLFHLSRHGSGFNDGFS